MDEISEKQKEVKELSNVPQILLGYVKEFKIGVESELRKEDHFREVIERLKEDSIKKGKNKYFITIA